MTLVAEFAVEEPGTCPVASASEAGGSPVTSVSRASIAGSGPVTEEFAAPADAADAEADVDRVGTAGSEAIYRFERDPGTDCVCESIESVAGPASDVRAEDGGLVVTVRVDDSDAVRAVVDRLRERFDGVAVRSLTTLDDATALDLGLVDGALLTDRQRDVLETAHQMGYFDYPKGANAGDVAAELDISRSTLAEHLAAAQSKLFGSVLDSVADLRD